MKPDQRLTELSEETDGDADQDGTAICDVLGDDRSLRLIATIQQADGAIDAGELADFAGIPESTVYRKMDAMTETPLVSGAVRIGEHGPQATKYELEADTVTVRLDADGVDVSLDDATDPTE